jgi:Tfp pilus assembly protein PilO
MAVPGMWFAFGLMLLITVILVVVIWQLFATRRAHAALARDEAYRKLAEQAVETQQKTAEDLADLRERIERIENVLKEVE